MDRGDVDGTMRHFPRWLDFLTILNPRFLQWLRWLSRVESIGLVMLRWARYCKKFIVFCDWRWMTAICSWDSKICHKQSKFIFIIISWLLGQPMTSKRWTPHFPMKEIKTYRFSTGICSLIARHFPTLIYRYFITYLKSMHQPRKTAFEPSARQYENEVHWLEKTGTMGGLGLRAREA
jgi:hypothetical protein